MPSLSSSPWIRGAPQWVCKAHLSNEFANFGGYAWPAASWSRFPAPISSEARAMSGNHCCWLEDHQRAQHFGCQAIETSKHKPVDIAEDKPFRRLTPQHVGLMAKNENFGLQRSTRPEQSSHNVPNQSTSAIAVTITQFADQVSCIGFAVRTVRKCVPPKGQVHHVRGPWSDAYSAPFADRTDTKWFPSADEIFP